MPEWMVFSVAADGNGRAEPIEAPTAAAAEAQVLAAHPGAITAVMPAEVVEGCNRTLMLWQWMGTVKAPEPRPDAP